MFPKWMYIFWLDLLAASFTSIILNLTIKATLAYGQPVGLLMMLLLVATMAVMAWFSSRVPEIVGGLIMDTKRNMLISMVLYTLLGIAFSVAVILSAFA